MVHSLELCPAGGAVRRSRNSSSGSPLTHSVNPLSTVDQPPTTPEIINALNNPLINGRNANGPRLDRCLLADPTKDALDYSDAVTDASTLEKAESPLPKTPEFTASEENADKSLTSKAQKLYTVLLQRKIFYIVILSLIIGISITGLVVSVLEYRRQLRLLLIEQLVMYSAVAMISCISTCGRASVSHPGVRVEEPEIIKSLRRVLERISWNNEVLWDLIDEAKNYLNMQECSSAADVYNTMFNIGYDRYVTEAKSMRTEMSTFSRGWALGWTLMRSEGILHFQESPVVSSFRSIYGVTFNVMCLTTMKNSNLAQEIVSLYECTTAYNVILQSTPVDQVQYQMRVDTMLDLVQDLGIREEIPNLLPNILFHIFAYSAVLLISILALLYFIRAPFAYSRYVREEKIVQQDFHVNNRVEMRRSTLRILDYYTWRLGSFENIHLKELERVGFELAKEEKEPVKPPVEAAPAYHDHDGELSGDVEERVGDHPAQQEEANSGLPAHRNGSLESLAQQWARLEQDDLKTYRGRTILRQSDERSELIARYVDASTSLDSSSQIQLIMHKVAYSILLLRPFIPRYVLQPRELDYNSVKNLGPSVHSRRVQVILQEGLEADRSTYVFVSFYPFNRSEVVTSALEFHQAKNAIRRRQFMEQEAVIQAEKCCLFRDNNLDSLYRETLEEDQTRLMTDMVETELAQRWKDGKGKSKKKKSKSSNKKDDSDDIIDLESSSDEEQGEDDQRSVAEMTPLMGESTATGRRMSNTRPIIMDAVEDERMVTEPVGGRLTNAENIVVVVLDRKEAQEQQRRRRGSSESAVVVDLNSQNLDGSHFLPPHYNGHAQPPPLHDTRSETSSNPLSMPPGLQGEEGGTRSSQFVENYPLSCMAAGINYVVETIYRCAGVFQGEVVQICGEGALIKYTSDMESGTVNRLGAKHTRSDSAELQANIGGDNEVDADEVRTELTVAGEVFQLSCSERAVRTAAAIQHQLRNYMDFSEDMYIPPELLQCPMVVLNEEYSLQGRLGYHVSKHFAVLSRSIPLVFALERISIEYGAEILLTESVKNAVEGLVLARPVHYLRVLDLNYHYITPTKTSSRSSKKPKTDFNGSLNGSIGSPGSPKGGEDVDSPLAMSPTNSTGAGSPTNKIEKPLNPEDSCFSAEGSLYELFGVVPLKIEDPAYASYASEESKNRVRHEHWKLIWEKYIGIVGLEPQILLLRRFVTSAEKEESVSPLFGGAGGETNRSLMRSALPSSSLTSSGGVGPLNVLDRDGKSTSSGRHSEESGLSNPMESSTGNNISTSQMEIKGQGILSSIYSMRDRVNDFMRELHTYNHIYEFSSREQYSCEKLWKYGHDLLISLGVSEEELDNEYGG